MTDVSVRRLLEVARDFDGFGGASAELVAWELSLELPDVAAPWADAVAQGLLREAEPFEPARPDLEVASDEAMWRLSAAGWSLLGVDPAADHTRAETVERMGLLAGASQAVFDALVRVSASLLGTTGSAVNIFDERYQHRIAAVNLPLGAGPAHDSFCRVAVDLGSPILTGDATTDGRFAHSTYTQGDAPVRFYAAAPLRAVHDATIVGTLCVFDHEPRTITEDEHRMLTDLAALAQAQVDFAQMKVELSALQAALEDR